MASKAILVPVVALVGWTFVMWGWMYATRIPAIRRARMRFDRNAPRGEQMSTLPPNVRWKADNYNHLFEQPTLFYAIALVLYVLDQGHGLALALAWAYVGMRVVHSVFQATKNVIEIRFVLFILGSLLLLALTILAGLAALAA